jgi:hypothetical protein
MNRRLDFFKSNKITLYCDDSSFLESSVDDHVGATDTIASLVSVTPRSSTWANHYFWAVLEALWHGSDIVKPYQHFYLFGNKQKIAVGVGHCHAPLSHKFMPPHLQELEYPNVSYNYFLNILNHITPEEEAVSNPLFRPVLVYRNPRDQITSYSRGLWSPDHDWVKEIAVIVKEAGGDPQPVKNISEFIREGGAQAICYYIRSFVDLQRQIGDRVLMLPYEKFIENRAAACQRMVRHIFANSGIEFEDEMIRMAAEATNRNNLSRFEQTRNLGLSHWHGRNAPGAVRNGKAVLHVANGNIGQWQMVMQEGDISFIESMKNKFELDDALFTYT